MVLGEEESVLFREVSLFQGCPYRGVPLYTVQVACLALTRVSYAQGDQNDCGFRTTSTPNTI